MDYLVVAPNTPYYHWQLSILAQSFKVYGLQENLCVVLMVDEESPAIGSRYNHFANLPRLHALRLKSDPDHDIMRLDGMAFAVENGLVSSTFVSIPPHSVLRYPVQQLNANFSFNCKPDFTFGHLNSYGISCEDIVRRLGGRRQWFPVGEVFGFKTVDQEFFQKARERARLIAFDSYRKSMKEFLDKKVKSLFRAGISISLLEYYGHQSIDTSGNFECQMTDADNSANFVNYSYGSPPDFNKMYFKMDDNLFGFSDSPFEAIMRAATSPPADFMKKVLLSMSRPS